MQFVACLPPKMGRGNRRLPASSSLSCEILSRKLRQVDCFFPRLRQVSAGLKDTFSQIVVQAYYLLLCLMCIYLVHTLTHTHAQPEWLVAAHTLRLRVAQAARSRRSAYDLRLSIIIIITYYRLFKQLLLYLLPAACCLSFCWHFARVEFEFGNAFFNYIVLFCPLEPTQNSFAKRCVSNPIVAYLASNQSKCIRIRIEVGDSCDTSLLW